MKPPTASSFGVPRTAGQFSAIVEVTVVDVNTGEAIPHARASLSAGTEPLPDAEAAAIAEMGLVGRAPTERVIVRDRTRPQTDKRAVRSAEPDRTGKVVFSNVEAGPYRLLVSADGYASQEYGQSVQSKFGMPLIVSGAGKTTVALHLSRIALVTGVVRDSNAKPLSNIQVNLLQPGFTVDGKREFRVASGTTTDQDGRFSVRSATPGQYFVVAGRMPGLFPTSDQQFYKWSYYPGTSEEALASPVSVTEGGRIDGIDLVVAPATLHSVRGRVDFGGLSPVDGVLSVYSQAAFVTPGTYARQLRATQPIAADGRFELKNLADGRYSVGLLLNRRHQRPVGPASSAMDDAYFNFEVGGKDLEDLTLRVLDASLIRGRVRTVDGKPLSSVGTIAGRLQISFQAIEKLQPDGFAVIDPTDGSFSIKGISGKYRVSLSTRVPYVTEIRRNGERVQDGVVDLVGGTTDVEILLDTKGGTISGRVVGQRNQPPDIAVSGVLLPDPLQIPVAFYRQFLADADGSLYLEGIPPGNYRIYAWHGVEPSSYFDPELLERSRGMATPLRVNERSQTSVDVKVIRGQK